MATTTTVNASATTAGYGQAVSLYITVSASTLVNGTQPTGTVMFTGAGSTTAAQVSGGSANVTLNNLPVGSYTIGTTYSGDANYAASTANTVVVAVTQATGTLMTQLSSTSFTTGSSSVLTVTVTLPGNAQLASGSTFLATIAGVAGATYTGTFGINVGGNTGTGAVMIPAPIAGSYTLQVQCGTNANFTCAPNSLTITSTATSSGTLAGMTATTTALAISPTAPTAGQTVALTATISASATAVAANPITGVVNFYDGLTLLGSGTIATVAGHASATTTAALTGTAVHQLTAVYAGDTMYAPSTSTALAVTLAAAPAAVSLSSNTTTTTSGSSVVFTATVSGMTTTGLAPTGTVTFYIATPNAAVIGTASVGTVGNGVATAVLSTSNLPDGTLTIYATYNGDGNFGAANSKSITVGLSDYSVVFAPLTMSLTQGQSGSATVAVGLVNGFPGTVVLGCAPASGENITCSFSPSTVVGGGSSTLTVTTAVATRALNGGGSMEAIGGVALAGMLCWLLPSKRRRVPALLLLLLAVGMTVGLGCGAGVVNTSGLGSAGGTPLGTTLLVISTAGTDGSATVRHNYTYQVTVQ